MNIQEKLQNDLETARQQVAALEAQLANLPAEVATVPETEWERIVGWFKAL